MTNPNYASTKHIDFDSIPIIDLTGVEAGAGRARIGAQIIAAAQTVGFFYISGHGVGEDLRDQAFAASRAFFEKPEGEKAKVAVDQNQRGWMAQGMTKLEGSKTHDAKEVFFWGWDVAADDPDLLAGVPMVAQNQWPAELRADLMPYYLAVTAMGRHVMAAIAVGLGLPATFFAKGYEAPLARGQLVYYPKMEDDDMQAERFGAAAHSDFGALTILMQDNNGGLQVQNKAGDWIAAPPVDGTFVCNIGDLLERWTNRRLVSTKHRVLNTSGRSRYSIPIFFDPNARTIIDPADVIGSGEVAQFAPITAGDHIMGRNKRNFAHYSKG